MKDHENLHLLKEGKTPQLRLTLFAATEAHNFLKHAYDLARCI